MPASARQGRKRECLAKPLTQGRQGDKAFLATCPEIATEAGALGYYAEVEFWTAKGVGAKRFTSWLANQFFGMVLSQLISCIDVYNFLSGPCTFSCFLGCLPLNLGLASTRVYSLRHSLFLACC